MMLELRHNGVYVRDVLPGRSFSLPGGDVVSPAYAGWSSGPYTLSVQEPSDAEKLEREREQMSLSDIQFSIAAVAAGFLTAEEAEGWVARGDIPTVALAAIAALPEEVRPVARIRFAGARTLARNDPFVGLVAQVLQMTPEQVDDFFRLGATL